MPFFANCYWEPSMLFNSFVRSCQARRVSKARQRGNRKVLESCDPCDPSLGSLAAGGYLPSTDILCKPHFRRFLSSILCCYLLSKWNIHFFILVFSEPTVFSLSIPVLYFPCLLQHSNFVNHNGTKMVDIWNVNKHTEARTKMEVGKLRTKTAQWLSQCHQTKWRRM